MDTSTISLLTSVVAQALFHFLWQGLMVWGAVECLMYVVQPRRAQTRYAVYCGALLLLAACPVVTLVTIFPSSTAKPVSGVWRSNPFGADEMAVAAGATAESEPTTSPASWLAVPRQLPSWIDRFRAPIALAWLAGVAVFGSRLAVGIVKVWTLARRGAPLPAEWSARVDQIVRQMQFRASPDVRVVAEISQAMAVGVIRPVILLPLAWVCQLDAAVLETVIAHELAHVRRWDLAINLAQRLIEAVLFFHPVVWWCSQRIRVEREMCCDEAAVASLGSRVEYVRALSQVAQQAGSSYEPALGAGIGGSKMVLLERIRSLLGVASVERSRFYGLSCAAIGAVAASFVWGLIALYSAREGVPDDVPAVLHARRTQAEPAVPVEIEGQTKRFMFGSGVKSNARSTRNIKSAPTEHAKQALPLYTIAPPDILSIEFQPGRPKPPDHLQSGHVLRIAAEPPEAELDAVGFGIDASGCVELGSRFGKVQIGGLTADEAEAAIEKAIGKVYPNPTVSLEVIRSSNVQPVTGEHLVAPDGTVNMGTYGLVYVAGMTLPEATRAIEDHLAKYLETPHASVSIFAYNSKIFYVIAQRSGEGASVTRLPITGNETVLDAIAQVNGLGRLSKKKIWIARPAASGAGCDAILPVNWDQISSGAATATNYQMFPGDRVFVVEAGYDTTAGVPLDSRRN